MRRACVILASACLVLFVGCRDYDIRLEKTLEEMKYQQKLEKNLEKAPTKGALQTELIYVRPPKGLTGPTQTFSLVAVEPGKVRPRKQLYRPGEVGQPSCPGPTQEAQAPAQERSPGRPRPRHAATSWPT